nr:MAG TPA: hypothetical protein [Bacteriophage sp.]
MYLNRITCPHSIRRKISECFIIFFLVLSVTVLT